MPQVIFVQGTKREREKEREMDIGRQKFPSQSFDMSHGAKMRIGDTKEGWARVC